MAESTDTVRGGAAIRYTGLPQDALRRPLADEPMALSVVRGHAGRCPTCCETALCDDGEDLVRAVEADRAYRDGRS